MMSSSQERILMDVQEMSRALTRISHEILERNKGVQELALVGIRTGGVFLAQRMAGRIQQIENREVPIGELDITLYRDDLSIRKDQPEIRKTIIPFKLIEGTGNFPFEPIMLGKVFPPLAKKMSKSFLRN
jgi:pyrimidine operon attenuation protein/uracil phosphoribosyltransferase